MALQPFIRVSGFSNSCFCSRLSVDGGLCITGDRDGFIRIFDVDQRTHVTRLIAKSPLDEMQATGVQMTAFAEVIRVSFVTACMPRIIILGVNTDGLIGVLELLHTGEVKHISTMQLEDQCYVLREIALESRPLGGLVVSDGFDLHVLDVRKLLDGRCELVHERMDSLSEKATHYMLQCADVDPPSALDGAWSTVKRVFGDSIATVNCLDTEQLPMAASSGDAGPTRAFQHDANTIQVHQRSQSYAPRGTEGILVMHDVDLLSALVDDPARSEESTGKTHQDNYKTENEGMEGGSDDRDLEGDEGDEVDETDEDETNEDEDSMPAPPSVFCMDMHPLDATLAIAGYERGYCALLDLVPPPDGLRSGDTDRVYRAETGAFKEFACSQPPLLPSGSHKQEWRHGFIHRKDPGMTSHPVSPRGSGSGTRLGEDARPPSSSSSLSQGDSSRSIYSHSAAARYEGRTREFRCTALSNGFRAISPNAGMKAWSKGMIARFPVSRGRGVAWQAHERAVTAVAFAPRSAANPSCTLAVTGDLFGMVKLWNVAKPGVPLIRSQLFSGIIDSFVFLRDRPEVLWAQSRTAAVIGLDLMALQSKGIDVGHVMSCGPGVMEQAKARRLAESPKPSQRMQLPPGRLIPVLRQPGVVVAALELASGNITEMVTQTIFLPPGNSKAAIKRNATNVLVVSCGSANVPVYQSPDAGQYLDEEERYVLKKAPEVQQPAQTRFGGARTLVLQAEDLIKLADEHSHQRRAIGAREEGTVARLNRGVERMSKGRSSIRMDPPVDSGLCPRFPSCFVTGTALAPVLLQEDLIESQHGLEHHLASASLAVDEAEDEQADRMEKWSLASASLAVDEAEDEQADRMEKDRTEKDLEADSMAKTKMLLCTRAAALIMASEQPEQFLSLEQDPGEHACMEWTRDLPTQQRSRFVRLELCHWLAIGRELAAVCPEFTDFVLYEVVDGGILPYPGPVPVPSPDANFGLHGSHDTYREIAFSPNKRRRIDTAPIDTVPQC